MPLPVEPLWPSLLLHTLLSRNVNSLYKYTTSPLPSSSLIEKKQSDSPPPTTMGLNKAQSTALTLAAIFCLFSVASAQAPAPGPATAAADDCFNSLLNMSDCLTFVEMGSNVSRPEKMCCPSFAGLVESNPICLCQLLGNTSAIGIPIDMTKALSLPTVCNVTTPPVSLCSEIGIPVGAPMAMDMPGSPPMSEGMVPSMTPDIAPPGSAGSRSIWEFSQVIVVGISSAVVAILV